MSESQAVFGGNCAGVARRWKGIVAGFLALAVIYVKGYAVAGAQADSWHFWAADLNPLPWLGAVMLMAVYWTRYDRYKVEGGAPGVWWGVRVLSFMAGVLVALALWESPLNGFVGRSMTLYTVKLMGEFELAAPLIVFGIPFGLVDATRTKGVFWSVLRFLHNPGVTAVALAIVLALWDMSAQMALGLRDAFMFAILPGVYLGLGMVVWIQSLQALPSFPNFSSHLRKGIYVWAMETTMMGMGAMWFWSAMTGLNPSTNQPLVFGLSRITDVHMAGATMMALSLPTMCLVFWHFWQWIANVVGVSENDDYKKAASR
ncbi:MAG: cytochrome c oxidase assembly protein [Acidiferrobacter sp.]